MVARCASLHVPVWKHAVCQPAGHLLQGLEDLLTTPPALQRVLSPTTDPAGKGSDKEGDYGRRGKCSLVDMRPVTHLQLE